MKVWGSLEELNQRAIAGAAGATSPARSSEKSSEFSQGSKRLRVTRSWSLLRLLPPLAHGQVTPPSHRICRTPPSVAGRTHRHKARQGRGSRGFGGEQSQAARNRSHHRLTAGVCSDKTVRGEKPYNEMLRAPAWWPEGTPFPEMAKSQLGFSKS